MAIEIIASGPQHQLIANPHDEPLGIECLLIPAHYDPEKITVTDIWHDGQIWAVGLDPRDDADAASEAYNSVCDYLNLKIDEQEAAALSAAAEFLPLEARQVKTGDNDNPSANYYLWLIGQILEAAE